MTPPSSPDAIPANGLPPGDLPAEVQEALDNPTCPMFGRYLILDELGRGGMGVVYKAWDPSLCRLVAIKTMSAPGILDPKDLQRFKREARAAARLRHPSIVHVFEVGEHDGAPFFVLDFIEGQNFESMLKTSPPLTQRLQVIRDVALGLEHAHSQGVIHRDVKPQNIMVKPDQRAILMDFGLARDQHSQSTLTMAGQILGTPQYMSPEQVECENPADIGPGADIYALGTVLFRACCDQPPFSGGTTFVLLKKVTCDPPPSPRSLVPQLPAELEEIILRCLEKRPQDRYPTAQALAHQLDLLLRGELPTIKARPPAEMRPTSAPAAPSRTRRSSRRTAVRSVPREPFPPIVYAAIGAALVVLGGLSLLAMRRSDDDVGTTANATDDGLAAAETVIQVSFPGEQYITGDSQVTLTGQVTSDLVEAVYLRNEPIPITAGHFEKTIDLSELPDGRHSWDLSTELGGQPLAKVTINFDRTEPRVEISSPSPNSTITTREDLLIVGRVHDTHPDEISVEGLEPRPVNEDGSFELEVPVTNPEGKFQIPLVARDRAGNQGHLELPLTLVLSGPSVSIKEPAVERVVTRETTQHVRGRAAGAPPLTVTLNGRPLKTDASGEFATPVSLNEEGLHSLEIVVDDCTERPTAIKTLDVICDRSPPVIDLEAPREGLVTSQTRLLIHGLLHDANPPAWLMVGERQVQLDAKGSFEAALDLPQGTNTLTLRAVDQAGNSVEETRTIEVDSQPPSITFTKRPPDELVGRSKTIHFSGQVSEDGCLVSVNGQDIELSKRRFEFQSRHTLVAGENIAIVNLEVVVTDRAGNLSRTVATVVRQRKPGRRGWLEELLPDGLHIQHQTALYVWTGAPGIEIEMVYVPPGPFIMGNDDSGSDHSPQHRHALTKGYWIGRYELTLAQYAAFCDATGHPRPPPAGWLGDPNNYGSDPASIQAGILQASGQRPVVMVTHADAQAFCKWAGLTLPTEAQWEKAARGNDGRNYPWGNDLEAHRAHWWPSKDGYGDGYALPHVGGRFPQGASPYGAQDMIGNVMEFCAGPYHERIYDRYARRDFRLPMQRGSSAMARGGHIWGSTQNLPNAYRRYPQEPDTRNEVLGFRTALPGY